MNEYHKIIDRINSADVIVVVQADNPDADSLASSLLLEEILSNLGKQIHMYCALDMPDYLKYLSGWDRVEKEMPIKFDLSIIVDTSSISLLDKLDKSAQKSLIAKKPCVVIDHHEGVDCDIPYATDILNDSGKVSTGEVIYNIAKIAGWKLTRAANEFIANSILADSLNLTSSNTTSDTYRVMAELIDNGVDRPKLEEARREYSKMQPEIFRYKAKLIERTELLLNDRLACVSIPQSEINTYSPLYNPGPLIQGDHLQTLGVQISLVLKVYDGGRITATIRSSNSAPIAAKLAKHFGGGGHANAAGFKIENAKISELKQQCVDKVTQLLEENAK